MVKSSNNSKLLHERNSPSATCSQTECEISILNSQYYAILADVGHDQNILYDRHVACTMKIAATKN